MKNLHSTLFVANSSLPHWTELGGRASGVLLWFGHPCFLIVPKGACERDLGGSRIWVSVIWVAAGQMAMEEGLGCNRWSQPPCEREEWHP